MWPSLDRYNAAIHQPETCFNDAALRGSWPVRDRRGLPAPASGSFGCVYHIHSWDRSWALKCFTREVPTSEWRYTEVSAYIRAHASPFFVECEYLVPRGIMVDGRWYPVLKMDWVDGQTLDRFLSDRLDNPQEITALSDIWVQVTRDLEERGMAHGDLQHGNTLISDEEGSLVLKLVDYDGMYVPSFKGEEGNESGLRDYQHPQRSGRDFNEYMDNFSALVIYLSLRALALRPDLWARYHTGENLIFQRSDFEQPDQSPLFADLHDLFDPRLAALLDTLRGACLDPNPCSLASLPSLVTGSPALRPPPVKPPPVPPTPDTGPPAVPGPAAGPAVDDGLIVVCPHCRVTNRRIARYCRGCGLALPYTSLPGNTPLPLVGVQAVQVKICPWCGLENRNDARWCVGCTALLDV